MIDAKVVEDSISYQTCITEGRATLPPARITTIQLVYPRFVHAEFMTHRVFSRNASSSRAIPVRKMIEQVRTDPAVPIHWGKNKPGMQATEELDGPALDIAKSAWLNAANAAAGYAEVLALAGVHKQIANRVLEPFQYIKVIVTATDWSNFFELRCHLAAQPEMASLANEIREAMAKSVPIARYKWTEGVQHHSSWHLPYISEEERNNIPLSTLLKVSTARCARVTHLKHDGTPSDIREDCDLYNRLLGSKPIHASPSEHQARPMDTFEFHVDRRSGNFFGWVQHRKLIEKGLAPTQDDWGPC